MNEGLLNMCFDWWYPKISIPKSSNTEIATTESSNYKTRFCLRTDNQIQQQLALLSGF